MTSNQYIKMMHVYISVIKYELNIVNNNLDTFFEWCSDSSMVKDMIEERNALNRLENNCYTLINKKTCKKK